MSSFSEELARAAQLEQARAAKKDHPDGWAPSLSLDSSTGRGSLTVRSAVPAPVWDDLLREWGLDPALYAIEDDRVQMRTWDAAIGEGKVQRFYYYRATVHARGTSDNADVAALAEEIKRRKFKTVTRAVGSGNATLVVVLADWQIGQRGTDDAVRRILALCDEIPQRWRELLKQGVSLDDILLVGLGDLVEGCEGWYPAQPFLVELNEREQRTLVRRLVVKLVEAALSVAPRVRVAAVGGNHGEVRRGGKAITDASDNSDVEVIEQVAEIIAASEVAPRVSFVIPRDELALTLDVQGTIVGITHGHLAKRGSGAANKVQTWWQGQALGMRPVADATVLLTGHYHHLSVTEHGPRTHFQAPALCGPSAWFTDLTGVGASPSGALSVVIDKNGWDHLRVLPCRF
jgi:hypothetical protein